MEIERDHNDKIEYRCPANNAHKIIGIQNFRNHIMRCKETKGKRFYQCKFEWTHFFKSEQERNYHEMLCEFYREGVERLKDYMEIEKDEEETEKVQERDRNIKKSAHYFHKNRAHIEYEKELKRKKREYEAQKLLEQQKTHPYLREEMEKFPDLFNDEDHKFYLVTYFASFFLTQLKDGYRKFEKKQLEIKTPIELRDELLGINEKEYSLILGGEFTGTETNFEKFLDLKEEIDKKGPLSCWQYCEPGDELILLVSKKYVKFLPQSRLAILVLSRTNFLAKKRPYNIPLENRSNVFVNYGWDDPIEKTEPHEIEEEKNDFFEILQWKNKVGEGIRKIIGLQEFFSKKDVPEGPKDEQKELKDLAQEKKKLEKQIKEFEEKEKKMKRELDRYKNELTQQFVDTVKEEQKKLTNMINEENRKKNEKIEELEKESMTLQEKEKKIREYIEKRQYEIDLIHKKKKKEEHRETALLNSIAEKKKTIQVSKSLEQSNLLDYTCHVCQQNRIDILFYPCNHFFVCENCQRKAAEAGRHECLYCFQSVEKIIRVLV